VALTTIREGRAVKTAVKGKTPKYVGRTVIKRSKKNGEEKIYDHREQGEKMNSKREKSLRKRNLLLIPRKKISGENERVSAKKRSAHPYTRNGPVDQNHPKPEEVHTENQKEERCLYPLGEKRRFNKDTGHLNRAKLTEDEKEWGRIDGRVSGGREQEG